MDALAVDTTVAAPRAREDGPRPVSAEGRSLSGEKAQRIIEAMRRSVAKRGTAGSTFDHVSREAGVSRGLLHYYFGTKEQLLVEAVRRMLAGSSSWADSRIQPSWYARSVQSSHTSLRWPPGAR